MTLNINTNGMTHTEINDLIKQLRGERDAKYQAAQKERKAEQARKQAQRKAAKAERERKAKQRDAKRAERKAALLKAAKERVAKLERELAAA